MIRLRGVVLNDLVGGMPGGLARLPGLGHEQALRIQDALSIAAADLQFVFEEGSDVFLPLQELQEWLHGGVPWME